MKFPLTKSGLRKHTAFAIVESDRPVAAAPEAVPEISDLLRRSIEEMERIGEALRGLSLTHEEIARRALQSDSRGMRLRLAKDYLPVMDALGRLARTLSQLTGADAKPALAPLAEAARRVEEKGWAYFTSMGVQAIESVGKPFDRRLHEPVELRAAAPEFYGRVLEEIARGYCLDDEVLRAARVVVGTGGTSPGATNQWDLS
jgi:molecular chaperone GrpE